MSSTYHIYGHWDIYCGPYLEECKRNLDKDTEVQAKQQKQWPGHMQGTMGAEAGAFHNVWANLENLKLKRNKKRLETKE